MKKINLPKMAYFIPEWDDYVYDKYDYLSDEKMPGAKKIYAHEIYAKPNYDGILVSKLKIEENKRKFKEIKNMGVHTYYRFQGPIFGDCGAWGYHKEIDPPFKTKEILEYYDEFGFDLGVSIDHLCISNSLDENMRRQQLSIKNAEEFINLYTKKDYDFVPIGAIQGWDTDSYVESFQDAIDLNYDYIAIGGVAKTPTDSLLRILKGLKPCIQAENNKRDIKLGVHLFGISRLRNIREFMSTGITSTDSASELRKSWLSSRANYYSTDYQGYSAIRLPKIKESSLGTRYRKIIASGLASREELEEYEENLRSIIHSYDNDEVSAIEVAEAFQMFENSFNPDAPNVYSRYLHTLEDRPWKKCKCTICTKLGIDVIIFRGNNRNRSRGFHNVHIFYSYLQKLIEDPNFEVPEKEKVILKKSPFETKRSKRPIIKEETVISTNEVIISGKKVKRKIISKRSSRKNNITKFDEFFDEFN